MLRWVRQRGCSWNAGRILVKAVMSGNLELTAWVKQQPGVLAPVWAISKAAGAGHTAICQFLRSEQCPWDVCACDAAAFKDHLDTLLWLRGNGAPFELSLICESAGQGGSIRVITYLHEQDLLSSELLTHMLNIAGAYNHTAAAQLLRRLGAEWPAVLNRLHQWDGDTLAWAREEGCTSPTQ